MQHSEPGSAQAPGAASAGLTAQDRQNILRIHEMFGGEHSKPFIERVYLNYGKSMDVTLDAFLSGNIPKKEEELHVIIEK